MRNPFSLVSAVDRCSKDDDAGPSCPSLATSLARGSHARTRTCARAGAGPQSRGSRNESCVPRLWLSRIRRPRLAGPSSTRPASSKREPWQGQRRRCSSLSQRTVQRRCGHSSDMTRKRSFSTRITSTGLRMPFGFRATMPPAVTSSGYSLVSSSTMPSRASTGRGFHGAGRLHAATIRPAPAPMSARRVRRATGTKDAESADKRSGIAPSL